MNLRSPVARVLSGFIGPQVGLGLGLALASPWTSWWLLLPASVAIGSGVLLAGAAAFAENNR